MKNTDEVVVLVDAEGNPIGTAPKAAVHTRETPLHLAFSCFLLSHDGSLLMTRRALTKKTWAGVWTNSFCGHPAPGEKTSDAVARRSVDELGCPEGALENLTAVLPEFRYRAVDPFGTVENELCSVYVARLRKGVELAPSPEEVCELAWVNPSELLTAVQAAPFAFSPWLVEELADPRLQKALMSRDFA